MQTDMNPNTIVFAGINDHQNQDATKINPINTLAQGVSFVNWKVNLNRIVQFFGMLWQTSSIQGMRKLYRV